MSKFSFGGVKSKPNSYESIGLDVRPFLQEEGYRPLFSEQDKNSAAARWVDVGRLSFVTRLARGEFYVTGEEHLARVRATKGIILCGASICMALWDDYQKYKRGSVLEKYIYGKRDCDSLLFPGDVFEASGHRYIMRLSRFAINSKKDLRWQRSYLSLCTESGGTCGRFVVEEGV